MKKQKFLEQKVIELEQQLQAEIKKREQVEAQLEELSTQLHSSEVQECLNPQFLTMLLDSLPIAVVVKEATNLTIQFWNKAATELFGYRDEEAIGKKAHDLFFPDLANFLMSKANEVLATSKVVQVPQHEIFNITGKKRLISIHKVPIFDSQNNIQYVVSISEDISDRACIEARLRDREAFLQSIYEGSEHGIFVLDPNAQGELCYQGWNPFLEKVTGFKSIEIEGKTPVEVFGSEWGKFFQNKYQRCYELGQVISYEEQISLADDQAIWFLTTLSPLRDHNGTIYRLIGTTAEITDRKKAEIERDRFFDISADLLCITDFEGNFKRVNPAFSTVLGYASDELINQRFINFVHPDDREKTIQEANKVSLGENTLDFENRYRCQDGSHKWLSWRGVPFVEEHLIYAIARDVTELKQVEIERRNLETLIESCFDFIGYTDMEGKAIFLNKAGQKLIGIENLAAIQEYHILDFVMPDERERLTQNVIPIVLEKGSWQGEIKFRHFQTGEAIWMDYYVFPLRDSETENYFGLATVSRDIRERKVAEAEQQKLVALIENSGDFIGVASLTGDAQYVNRAGRKLVGLEDSVNLDQMSVFDFIPPDNLSFFQGEALTTTLTQGNWQGEFYLKHFPSQQPISVEMNLFIVRHPGTGEPLCLATVTRDITDRKIAQAEIHSSRAELLALFNAMQDVIIVVDYDGRYLKIPATNAPLLYRPPADLVGKKAQDVFPPEVADFFLKSVRQVLETKTTVKIEYSLPIGDQIVWFDANIAPLDENSVVFVARDISDRKQAEIILKQQAEELEEALIQIQKTQSQLIQSEKMSSLGQLVAGVAHEINNPVNFIYGNVVHINNYAQDLISIVLAYQQAYANPVPAVQEVLEEVEFDFLITDLPKTVQSIHVGAQRIREIVASLRTFSRLDEAECKKVDLHEGIDSTLMILQNRLKAKGEHPEIPVIKKYGQLPLVECYAGQLNQVFMNILVNAIDALEERDQGRSYREIEQNPSEIHITTELITDKPWVRVTIADNGTGIPEDLQKRIFDPFFTTKTVGKGTGLGMSISYQIITEKHQGTLTCQSSPDQGSIFIIEIPIKQEGNFS